MSSIFPKDSKGKIVIKELTQKVFLEAIKDARSATGNNIESYKFNKQRCKILSAVETVKENCNGILYWMLRDCRVQDNWAMLFAQKLARKNKVPLYVCFFAKPVDELHPTKRQYNFLMKGLQEVSTELKDLNIRFSLINSTPDELVNIVKKNSIGGVVCDFQPLRKVKKWIEEISNSLPLDVPFIQVDAHNVVPIWTASNKQEVAARTIRPKITKLLDEFLEGFPCVSPNEYAGNIDLGDKEISFQDAMDNFKSPEEVGEVTWAKPGSTAGLCELHDFIINRVKIYGAQRNDPTKNATSNLSPWLHFGFISPQRCALEVSNMKTMHKESVESFLEEAIVRRELADNYCYYNENYDNLEGADKWAKLTLNVHRKDKRTYVYTKEQFENGLTHEKVWNAAQLQMVQEGKMHGYMRMYWCKKILEWSSSPEEAIKMGLFLNDKYSLDGSDPNGFVGVMWSVCGIHDRPWKERDIFGIVRFMVEYSLVRKFDSDAYCVRYNPKSEDTEENYYSLKRKASSSKNTKKLKN